MATGHGAAGLDANAFGPVRERLTAWRARRERGSCIPEDLWRPAVRLATEYGISRTSRVLRLGFRELKARVEKSRSDASPTGRDSKARFVELPYAAGLLGGPECLIEVERRGARIRIALNGRGTSELASVIETLVKKSGR
jgi:hypothetical protein